MFIKMSTLLVIILEKDLSNKHWKLWYNRMYDVR